MLLLSVFGQQDLTRVVSSLGESAHFSQTEVSGTATSKSCRLAHPNGRDFYDLRGVGDHVFDASADTSVPFGPALFGKRTTRADCALRYSTIVESLHTRSSGARRWNCEDLP